MALPVIALMAAALTACGGKQDTGASAGSVDDCTAGSGRITIATGNSTGVYYVIGGGLARLISDNTSLRATAAETGASVQNIEQLVSGAYDVAFSLADTASDAVEGTGSFTAAQPVRALTRLYPNYTQVVVRADSGITSVADMRGRTVSTGSPRSGTEVIANRLLAAAGLAETDVSAQRLDLDKTVSGMKDGSIDGLFWSGGLPTPALTDLFTSMGDQVRFVDVTAQLDALRTVSPVYERATIPAGTYTGVQDVPTIAVPNYLLVTESFADGNACAITRLLYDKRADLEKVHPAARQIDPEKAAETGNVPLHPGAEKALADVG
jgi:uncharacterized protein